VDGLWCNFALKLDLMQEGTDRILAAIWNLFSIMDHYAGPSPLGNSAQSDNL